MKRAVDWVDPLIDTANRRFFFLTTASHPFGMVNLSPDTRVGDDGWKSGYRYDDQYIHWFSHVHAWQLCALPIMPTMGDVSGHRGSENYKSRFSHDQETAQPGYHSILLERYNIHAELTATVRTGFHRYTCNESGDLWINLDIGATIMLPMSDALAQVCAPGEICGYVENERTCRRPKRTKIFYYIKFDQTPLTTKTWQEGQLHSNNSIICGPGSGIAAHFKVTKGDVIQLKVGISYCSIEQAKLNLDTELPHWDFKQVHQQASDEWNNWLSRIEVEGGTDAEKTKFYTNLFHAIKGRRRVSDVNGKYLDMTGDLPSVKQIPLDDNNQPLYDHHNSDAFWGTPWSLNLLWALIWPEATHNFCNTLVDMYRNGGLIPRGPSGGNYTYVMSAPTSTTFLVSAWMQGIKSFDIETAYEGMLKNHSPEGLMGKGGYEHYTNIGGGANYYLERGYVPQGIESDAMHRHAAATYTLEYAYHDWALAQLAQHLGKQDDYELLTKRSKNYLNLWDPDTRHFRPRTMEGNFIETFNLYDIEGWEEGNARQYRWFVPHDPEALIDLMGGHDQFISELDNQFKEAEKHDFVAPHGDHHTLPMDYGNQPCMYLAYLFNYAGAPELTQKWVQRIKQSQPKSDISPYGGFGGDEDQGQMGCLDALMALGLFNVQGGCHQQPVYELSVPLFDRITIHLSDTYYDGNTLEITCQGRSQGDNMIQSATFNDNAVEIPWVNQQDLVKGGSLNITLSPLKSR